MTPRHPRPYEDDLRESAYRGHTEDRDELVGDEPIEVDRDEVGSPTEAPEEAPGVIPEGNPDDVLAEERPPAEG
ncbi:hypothetical protein [Actinokineospora iranica]|uniref:Uncharacterized protein n=1 Tax=Actinokineospora iranica TaxID=1271860 RepID=A0A1G6RWK2_9PSEU|nr:hypothetical protein [Actinokineospora iranica]SDD08347.1 hypothetical protein SAMN05216174_10738 [Actinokineospora iranica]